MEISRHFVDIGARRVHYRRCGEGPVILMVHQSPRSSAEYEGLMRQWGERFTCIAPDTPGFGQSDPLPDPHATIDDFSDALVGLLDALGLERAAAYGFHSGGTILVNTLARAPERFTALAIGGYAIWTAEESKAFSESYLPPFLPAPYGEHLFWLWNRILEQTWFFPWFDTTPQGRIGVAHDDPALIDAVVREMLDAGDAYRVGYGAVLRAPREIPKADADTRPVLISAHAADVLYEHIDRLGALPPQWQAKKVPDAPAQQAMSLAWLAGHAEPLPERLGECDDEGFILVDTPAYRGRIHWRGTGETLKVHGPGRASELLDLGQGALAIDMPGHGLSDPWQGPVPTEPQPWLAVVEAARAALGCLQVEFEACPQGDPALLFPDLSPDRFGSHLLRAWSILRAGKLFSPWYACDEDHAIGFDPASLDPERLRIEHRARMRSTAALEWAIAMQADVMQPV